MKIKDGYILQQVAGQSIVLPIDGDIDMNAMIKLNETGAFLWERLQTGTTEDELTAALLAEYKVDEATARRSVQRFVEKLRDNGYLE